MQIDFTNTLVCEAPCGAISLNLGRACDLLNAGQTAEGTVLFASGSHVNIRLSDRTILRARLSEGVILAEGDRVWLSIREKSASSIVMELLGVSSERAEHHEDPGVALTKAGLQNTKLNMEIAAALKECGLEFKAEFAEQTAAVLAKYPKTGAIAAAFAVGNKIEIDANSMNIVSELQNSGFKVHSTLTGILSLLSVMNEPERNGNHHQPQPIITDTDLQNGVKNEEYGLSQLKSDGNLKRLFDEGFYKVKGLGIDLDGELEKAFFARAGHIQDGSIIKAAGEQLVFQLQLLRAFCSKQCQNGEKDIIREIDRLLLGLKLFSSLSRLSYMQIPIIMDEKRETMELYALKNNEGARPADPGTMKILIALDTQNLGRVEALVGIRDGRISVDFKLVGPKATDYLREGASALYDLASSSGYRISYLRFQSIVEYVTPVNALEVLSGGDREGNININVRV